MSERFVECAQSVPVPTRRTVVRSAAWAVPAVAVVSAAPAFAASNCTTYSVTNFGLTNGVLSNNGDTWTGTHVVAGQPSIWMQVSSTRTGSMQAYTEHFGTVSNAGGTGRPGLRLHQRRATANVGSAQAAHAGVYTVTFERPVTNLVVTLTDIDLARESQNYGRQWDDRVTITSPAAWSVLTHGDNILGTGADVSNALRTETNSNLPNTSGLGNVTLGFTGPVSQFTINYWNGFSNADSDSRSQLIFLNSISFEHEVCAV
jgi:hypothetical protein